MNEYSLAKVQSSILSEEQTIQKITNLYRSKRLNKEENKHTLFRM